MLGLILGQWRAGLYGLLAAGLIIGALTVNGWRTDAQAKAKAEVERDAAVDRERAAGVAQRAAERARQEIADALKKEEAKNHVEIQEVIKRVPVYLGGGDCALDVDGVRDLNAARGAQLPGARRLADDGPRVARSDTP